MLNNVAIILICKVEEIRTPKSYVQEKMGSFYLCR